MPKAPQADDDPPQADEMDRGQMKVSIARVARLRGAALGGAFVLGAFVLGCVHAPPVARPYPAPAPEALSATLTARQQAVVD